MLEIFLKDGFYIHFLQAFLYYTTKNIYISSMIAIKMYSVNYFYWYGHHFTYLKNPRHNWVKQFIRFTDTGHLATFLPLIYPSTLPVAHNIHFIIMAGYWIGKLSFNLKDADKLNLKDNLGWHTDVCTYIHHSVPYLLIHHLFSQESQTRTLVCDNEYNSQSLKYTYGWLYFWLFFIYVPWRSYTGDPVYSILDAKQTPKKHIFGFVLFANILIYFANRFGHYACELYPKQIAY